MLRRTMVLATHSLYLLAVNNNGLSCPDSVFLSFLRWLGSTFIRSQLSSPHSRARTFSSAPRYIMSCTLFRLVQASLPLSISRFLYFRPRETRVPFVIYTCPAPPRTTHIAIFSSSGPTPQHPFPVVRLCLLLRVYFMRSPTSPNYIIGPIRYPPTLHFFSSNLPRSLDSIWTPAHCLERGVGHSLTLVHNMATLSSVA